MFNMIAFLKGTVGLNRHPGVISIGFMLLVKHHLSRDTTVKLVL